MQQSIIHVALVVRDYDEAIAFFCDKLHFTLVEDTYQPEQDKRWVVVAPPGSSGASLLLARASTPEQETFIGRQSGGRVFLFLHTDDFWARLPCHACGWDQLRPHAEGSPLRHGGRV
jgi:catechol 2,3-dioxygenase-like lactoylglutathione lyase family enzyme